MKQQFLNEYLDCLWLRTTHIKDIDLPLPWNGFRSFVLIGTEDSPDSVELYLSHDPRYVDDFFVLDFTNPADSGVYDGKTRELKGQP